MTTLERKRQRYRWDVDYRERQIARVTSRHNQRLADPDYKRLSYIRKKIVEVRDSINTHMLKAASRERQLLKLITERDTLAAGVKARLKANERTSHPDPQTASIQSQEQRRWDNLVRRKENEDP